MQIEQTKKWQYLMKKKTNKQALLQVTAAPVWNDQYCSRSFYCSVNLI